MNAWLAESSTRTSLSVAIETPVDRDTACPFSRPMAPMRVDQKLESVAASG